MSLRFPDNTREYTTTNGTGSVTLTGAYPGCQTFATAVTASELADGDTFYYRIEEGLSWEVGLGTYAAAGPTIARTTLYTSSTGSKLSLGGEASIWADVAGAWYAAVGTADTVVDAGGDTTMWPLLSGVQTGALVPMTDAGLTYQATTNALTATTFVGALTGNVTGNVSGSSGSCIGNAGTATVLANTRTLWGQNFNGSANVTGSLTAVADITGGASSMTITAGTGNSRTLVFKTTTSGGTATTALTLAADQSATFAGPLTVTPAGSGQALTAIANGANGVVKVQNTSTDGYSIISFYDSSNVERASFGYGNSAAGGFSAITFFYLNSTDFVIGNSASTSQFYIKTGRLLLWNPSSAATDASTQIGQPSTSEIALSITGIALRTVALLQLKTPAGASLGNVGGCIFDHVADGASTHTDGTEDVLYTDTTVANTLAVDTDKIKFKYVLSLAGSATATRRVRVYFAGIVIFDSGTLTIGVTSGLAVCEGYIARKSATTCRAEVEMRDYGSATLLGLNAATYTPEGTLTGLTLSGTNIIKITGVAAGTGAASGDITAVMGTGDTGAAA